MKVLSVRQPYASLIVLGKKRFEARTWATKYRGRLVIHASSAKPARATLDEFRTRRALFNCARELGWCTEDAVQSLPRSAIIGAVTLVAVHSPLEVRGLQVSDLDEDACGGVDGVHLWEMVDPITIAPVPCDGKLNVWNLPAELAVEVQARLSAGAHPAEAAVNADMTGVPLELELWRAKGPLTAVLGDELMTMREAFRAFFNIPQLEIEEGAEPLLRLPAVVRFLAAGRDVLPLAEVGEHLSGYLARAT